MLRKATSYLRHAAGAHTRYSAHSPFIYDFATHVLPHRATRAGAQIDALRRQLLADRRVLEIEDFGAGYGGVQARYVRKTVAQVARSSARTRRAGELLYRICRHYEPRFMLELGTNLGVSTLYQMLAMPASRMVTIEGAGALVELAEKHFRLFDVQPELRQGDFTEVLRTLDFTFSKPDYVFIDGNHRQEPLLQYADFLLPRMERESILIVDDINWSAEMQQAWQELILRPEISVTADLFFLGVCFVKRNQAKEHFKFRFWE